MTQPEFLGWVEMYRLFPFCDRHRFHRPAALISVSLSGEHDDINAALESRLGWLEPDSRTAHLSSADANTLKAFGIKK